MARDRPFRSLLGQRLGDIARLTGRTSTYPAASWRWSVVRQEGAFKFGGRAVAKFPARHGRRRGSTAPLFPKRSQRKRPLTSNQFHAIMADAGLVEPRSHRSTGKGRDSRRTFNELSFHALRHTATSLFKNAGVSPAVVMDLIGHDSPAISAHYTHIEESAKRRAVDLLPDVTAK